MLIAHPTKCRNAQPSFIRQPSTSFHPSTWPEAPFQRILKGSLLSATARIASAEFLSVMENFMRTKSLILAAILAMATPLALADEGMWLFNAFPKERVKAHYGFAPTQAWLDHVRLGSVRFNNGGSGSFVSADGLAFTNHHVGADCIQKLSKAGTDYMKTGFYAKTRADEAKCPDLELNVLMGIEDVSAKVNVKSNAGLSAADAGQAQRSAMSAIEKDCTTSNGMRCDVVTLYSGKVF